MAASSVQVMPEHWTELNVARKQRDQCAKDVDVLKQACEKDCGKSHVVECDDCYIKVLERMRQRYGESSEREWFSQRGMFLQEMDDLFTEAKKKQVSLKTIEASIESEKEAWYRWVLRRYPEFLEVSGDSLPDEELRGMLDDPDRSRDELVAMMWRGVGKPAQWSEDVDRFLERISAAAGDSAELKKVYAAEFFTDVNSGNTLEHAQPYLDEYMSLEGESALGDVIGKISQENQRNRSTQPQRDSQARRLDELRRAKTAMEQNKVRLKGSANPGVVVKEELYDLPPCSNCQKEVSAQDVISCSLCQVATQVGGKASLTAFCSEGCYQDGQETHVEKSHPCDAGDKCAQLQDEDVDMDENNREPAVCITGNKVTLFCTEKCGKQNAGSIDGLASDAQSSMLPLREAVNKMMEEENKGLAFTTL